MIFAKSPLNFSSTLLKAYTENRERVHYSFLSQSRCSDVTGIYIQTEVKGRPSAQKSGPTTDNTGHARKLRNLLQLTDL